MIYATAILYKCDRPCANRRGLRFAAARTGTARLASTAIFDLRDFALTPARKRRLLIFVPATDHPIGCAQCE